MRKRGNDEIRLPYDGYVISQGCNLCDGFIVR